MWAVLFVFACVPFARGQDINDVRNLPKYDKRYDYLSVDAILENKRLVRNYVDCLINAKPCTPEGKALKRILPEALRTKCIRCTESQKQTAVKVIRRVKTEYPEDWQKLASRWDPTGDFTRYFEEFLIKEHFNTIPNSNEILGSPPTTPPARRSSTFPPVPSTQPPAPQAPPAPSNPQPALVTPPRPAILNRFGDDGELMVNNNPQPRPTSPRPTTARPVATTSPTQMTWVTAASDNIPTRFNLRPTKDISPPYTTAMTLIDQIGYKIIRTTELVTDILKNTVRAVVG
ncbi:uncharacterized protein [Choristoneura fumiferana]|uniref:uncharacterized protein n=1 Tax=Choristoneura fumiferana TaxID=7141 RepID=UPI003D15C2E4